jgi:branched-chain amino acid transport system substrate-binding protein
MEIGQTLNQRYTLTAAIGKGAMGTVYRATDAQTGQDVAIKVIARDLALDRDMLERFRREGEALRQLRHPNIVSFVDMFAHEGQQLIVMEYVPGGSLHDALRQGPLSVDRTRRMALELCDALTRAHHLNIIHRDLKPENVLLTADGSPKLTDFGVARLVNEGTRLTGTGAQVGTPFYMSPEAWEGKPLDAQTDIWSLGIVLYEMLSGRVPFNGDTVVAVMNKVLNAPLPDLGALRHDVPPGLAQIIQRMLERDKCERYQSMREVGADLERGHPPTALTTAPGSKSAGTRGMAPPAPTRAIPSAGRRPLWPWIVGGVMIVGLLTLGGLGLGAGWLFFGSKAAAPLASPTPPNPMPTVTAPATAKPATALPPATPGIVAAASSGRCGPGETELFFDDFENGPAKDWAFMDTAGHPIGAWPVATDGNNHVLVGTGHVWATRPGPPDVALQVRVRRTAPDGNTQINVRMGPETRYYVAANPGGELVRNPPGGSSGLRLARFELGNDIAWHTVRLAAVGHDVEVRFDNQVVAQADDAEGPLEGGIGLENTFGTLWYDDVLVCQLSSAAAVKGNPKLSVGVILPLSGPQAALGTSARDGIQMAVDEWNAQGGLLGRTILPDVADGQCEADPAVAAANRLINQDQVHYLIGEICSKASRPVSAIAESKHVVQISPASSAMPVTVNDDGSTKAYVFRACFVDPFQGTVMANFALGQHLQKAFVIWNQDDDYSRGLASYFMEAFKAGGTIVGQEAYAPETIDFATVLDKVAASQAQVLYMPDFSQRLNLIARQAQAHNLRVVLMGGDGWEAGDLDLAALNGGYYTTAMSPQALSDSGKAWVERYRAQYGHDPDAMAALGYDAANMLFTAIRQAIADDPVKVKDNLAGLHFDGITGTLTFDAQHNPRKSAVIMQIKDGQRVYAGTVQP